MSLVPGVNNPAIDNLVQSSLESEDKRLRLEWIACSEFINIEPTQIDNVHYAIHKRMSYGEVVESTMMLLCLGSDETCTQTLVSDFARIYSLPTHKYNNDVSRFGRFNINNKKWLKRRNKLIKGFTEYNNNYYMVANELLYHCYSRY